MVCWKVIRSKEKDKAAEWDREKSAGADGVPGEAPLRR